MMILVSTSQQSFEQVSTNICLSNIISFLQNIFPFMRKYFRERAESHGEQMHPKVVLGASVSLVAYFCTECAKRISLLENKISDSYKLLAKILHFCLGEATVFAKLVHEIGNLSENGSSNNVLLWGSFRQCAQVIQGSLHSTNIQVHMLGLHVLRSYAQKELTEGSETKTDSFMMLLTELLGDVFLVMQTTLKVLYGILLTIQLLKFLQNRVLLSDIVVTPGMFK